MYIAYASFNEAFGAAWMCSNVQNFQVKVCHIYIYLYCIRVWDVLSVGERIEARSQFQIAIPHPTLCQWTLTASNQHAVVRHLVPPRPCSWCVTLCVWLAGLQFWVAFGLWHQILQGRTAHDGNTWKHATCTNKLMERTCRCSTARWKGARTWFLLLYCWLFLYCLHIQHVSQLNLNMHEVHLF